MIGRLELEIARIVGGYHAQPDILLKSEHVPVFVRYGDESVSLRRLMIGFEGE